MSPPRCLIHALVELAQWLTAPAAPSEPAGRGPWRAAWVGLALAAVLPWGGAAQAAGGVETPLMSLVDEACDFDVPDPAVAARLRCARLHVPRDPADPTSGRFELAVAIRRSAAPKPGAAPVLFLHGGPGGQVTRYLGYSAREVVPGHDLVAFDMRGGGRSTPRVCNETFARLLGAFVDRDGPAAAKARRTQLAADCLAEFRAAGLDAAHFGTDRTVADAEALRAALGVERWLLLGESYGTTVAAHYLATHPQHIEAAVLDSLYPADDGVLPIVEMQGRMVGRIAADCRADAACAARFPQFGRAQLDAVVAALDAEPLIVGDGAAQRQLDGLALRQLVMMVSGFEAGARSLPLLLDAATRRDAAVLAGPLALLDADGDATANFAAMAATDCRDRVRHHMRTDLTDPMSLLTGLAPTLCREWTTPGPAPRWPTDIDVPVLFLAGGYDAFQPDATAIAAATGPNAQVVEIPHAVHGARGSGGCARDVVAGFLVAPTATLDASCIARMTVPAFLAAVQPQRGASSLAAAVAQQRVPPFLLGAVLAAVVSLLAMLVALWRRRRQAEDARGSIAWTAAAAGLAAAAVLAVVGVAASADPLASAVFLYGLPAAWSWLPWLMPVPALAGIIALWRGDGGVLARIGAVAAVACAVLLGVAGWWPMG